MRYEETINLLLRSIDNRNKNETDDEKEARENNFMEAIRLLQEQSIGISKEFLENELRIEKVSNRESIKKVNRFCNKLAEKGKITYQEYSVSRRTHNRYKTDRAEVIYNFITAK